MKCVLDRLILAAGCGDNQLKHKVGAALCTLRRSGGMETTTSSCSARSTPWRWCLSLRTTGTPYTGADKGEAVQDIEGVKVIRKAGPQYRMDAQGDRQGRNRAAGKPPAHDDELYPLIRMVIR